MNYCCCGPRNFRVYAADDELEPRTITYGTFNIYCGTQNPTS